MGAYSGSDPVGRSFVEVDEGMDRDGAIMEGVQCIVERNTDYVGGMAVMMGYANKKESAEECCTDCREHQRNQSNAFPCNSISLPASICGERFRDCWLKYERHPEMVQPTRGPGVGFTSGIFVGSDVSRQQGMQSTERWDRRFHVVLTASGLAQQWQSRICYYWYKKQKTECEKMDSCDMGGFTRILHSGMADNLMDEIPTFVSAPIPRSFFTRDPQDYVVLNRPYAVLSWLSQAHIEERYIMMIEPDHLLLHPLPNVMIQERPAVFGFFYITPDSNEFRNITQRLIGPMSAQQLRSIPHTGSSPSTLSLSDLKGLAPKWLELAVRIYEDEEANKAWGWVQEMYAFSFALHLTVPKQPVVVRNFMAQPPFDKELRTSDNMPYYICHYTYVMGEASNRSGWHFDKREYTEAAPKIEQIASVPESLNNSLVHALMESLKEAMESFQCWNSYAEDVQSPSLPQSC